MTFRFNSLLAADGMEPISPADVVLLRHQDGRAVRGRSIYELWRDDKPNWNLYQSHQRERNRTVLARPYWAAFIGTPDDRTMFVGLYRATYLGLNQHDVPWPQADSVDAAGTVDTYDLVPDERLAGFEERLYIDWGAGLRAWIQRADRQNKRIVELKETLEEPKFPGFLRLITPLSKVGAFPIGWKERLAEARGIYLLCCPRTREQYVGAALSDGGFLKRWLDYVRTGHEENVALKSRDPSD